MDLQSQITRAKITRTVKSGRTHTPGVSWARRKREAFPETRENQAFMSLDQPDAFSQPGELAVFLACKFASQAPFCVGQAARLEVGVQGAGEACPEGLRDF